MYVGGFQTIINQFKVLGLVNDCLLYKRNSLKMPSHFLPALTRKCEDHALWFRLYVYKVFFDKAKAGKL